MWASYPRLWRTLFTYLLAIVVGRVIRFNETLEEASDPGSFFQCCAAEERLCRYWWFAHLLSHPSSALFHFRTICGQSRLPMQMGTTVKAKCMSLLSKFCLIRFVPACTVCALCLHDLHLHSGALQYDDILLLMFMLLSAMRELQLLEDATRRQLPAIWHGAAEAPLRRLLRSLCTTEADFLARAFGSEVHASTYYYILLHIMRDGIDNLPVHSIMVLFWDIAAVQEIVRVGRIPNAVVITAAAAVPQLRRGFSAWLELQ